ncbi:MAG TPA: acyltransferase domain-containing protein, partial [Thermaerobacter sp.]
MSATAVVFPGQGAQYVGMGRDLYERFPEVRQVFAEASEAAGFDIARLCFEGPEEQLQLTEYQQPALLAVGVACWRV